MAGSTLASSTADTVELRRVLPARFSPWRDAWRRYRRHRLAMVSAVVLLAMAAAVTVGPSLWHVSINEIDFTARLEGPTLTHPLGTDDLGQDILARML